MAITVASLANLQSWVSAVLGANPEDGSFALADTTQGKYAPEMITLAIKYADLEIRRIIQETIGQGYRGAYMAVSAEMDDGASIPPHSGKTGLVEIKGSDSVWRPGILIANFEQFNKMKRNVDAMYGDGTSIEGRYHITEDDVINIIGTKARLKVPTELTIGSVLGSPQCYEPAVGRRALIALVKDGIDPILFGQYSQWSVNDENAIRGNADSLPPLDRATKQGA